MNEIATKTFDILFERYPSLISCQKEIYAATDAIINAYKHNGKLITAGNGGSAADAEHIVGELMKGFILPRKLSENISEKIKKVSQNSEYLIKNLQMPLRAVSLVNQIALGTAFANDQAPDLVFAQQILGLGDDSDVFLAISTSGNSKNILYAVEVAKSMNITTVCLTGKSGGKLKDMADIAINVPETETYKIQELHLPVYHALCIAVEAEFFSEA